MHYTTTVAVEKSGFESLHDAGAWLVKQCGVEIEK